MASGNVYREVAGAGALKREAEEAPRREGPVPPQAAPGGGLARSSRSRPGVRLARGCALPSRSHLLGRAGLGAALLRSAAAAWRGGSFSLDLRTRLG